MDAETSLNRHGECAHAPATGPDWQRLAVETALPCPARYSGARNGPGPPAHETAARVAHRWLTRGL